MKNLSM